MKRKKTEKGKMMQKVVDVFYPLNLVTHSYLREAIRLHLIAIMRTIILAHRLVEGTATEAHDRKGITPQDHCEDEKTTQAR